MARSSEKSVAASPAAKSTVESIKETLESIVVAFILAFVFRAFIVEAFVIPTGSMAVTLCGAQLTKTCSTCGYEYPFGVSLPPAGRLGNQPDYRNVRLRCPNCDMERDAFKATELRRPDSGDRILVHKWPFDVGGKWLGPKRWDVTVFKDPRDGTTNFIKRLIGLPGEVLEIIDGDIYTVPLTDLQKERPDLVGELEQLRREVYRHRQENADPRRRDIRQRYAELNRQLLPYLKAQRKTGRARRAQRSLWVNVYNHDFLPNCDSLRDDQLRTRVGWKPDPGDDEGARAAWDTSKREVTFNSDDDRLLYIRFDGKDIDDFSAYNNDGGDRPPGQRHLVGDLRLRFGWRPRAGTGGITLEMNRNRDKFIASLNSDGTVRLEAARFDDKSGEWKIPQVIRQSNDLAPFPRSQTTRIEFINVDYRVSLLVEGEEIISTTDDDYKPSLTDLQRFTEAIINEQDTGRLIRPSAVRIGARNLQCDLVHLVLERDIYYRSQRQSEKYSQTDRSVRNPYEGWPGWGTAGQPILLRPGRGKDDKCYHGEYYMLGDNSAASKDARLWWEIGPHLKRLGEEYQVGTVPEHQLIGKAFFVYWPAGYRASWAGGIGLIPNFGRMRWIR